MITQKQPVRKKKHILQNTTFFIKQLEQNMVQTQFLWSDFS